MLDFRYYAPTEVAFGAQSLSVLEELIKKQNCKKILLHYGGGSAEKSGLLSIVRSAIKGAAVEFCELGGVKPNPRLSLVNEGIALCKKENIDFILAVGGGSVIDSAKAVAYGVYDGGDVWDFYEGIRKPVGALPIGVVLTIAAAGSEMSNSSVITNEEKGLKRPCNTNFVRPKFAVMNPELTLTLPDYQTACGCTDILMHTMERYFTGEKRTMKLTDAVAEAVMKTVLAAAKVLKFNPADVEARAEIMWAGSLSHNGLTGCGTDGGDWVVHGLEHELGALYDVAHGAGLAAVWGSWARYVYKNCLKRFHLFAVQVMGVRPNGTREELALSGIEAFEEFLRGIDMPINLRQLGVRPTEAELRLMAKNAADACGGHKGSAKKLGEEDFYNILKAAQ